MRGLLIIILVICALLAFDQYRFDGFYTDHLVDMSRSIVRGVSR